MATPKQIGFHVPYTWDDATYMACTLAGLATQLGLPVSLLSNQAHETNIHYRWDHLVLSGKRADYGHWHPDCSHLIWFDIHKAKLEQAIKSRCVNIFVPLWHRLAQDQIDLLPLFDHIVCPHRSIYGMMRDVTPRAFHLPWDTGLPLTGDAMPSATRRIYVPIDSYTARAFGVPLLNALRILVEGHEDTTLTISYTKNWDRPAMTSLGDLIRCYPRRVRLLRKPSHSERVEAYLRHDWTFVASLRENAGLIAHESLCCRKPVVVFDIEPNRDLLPDTCASFVPCETRGNWLGVPEAVPNLSQLVDHLRALVDQPQTLQALAQNPWPWLESNRSLNYIHWREFWNLS